MVCAACGCCAPHVKYTALVQERGLPTPHCALVMKTCVSPPLLCTMPLAIPPCYVEPRSLPYSAHSTPSFSHHALYALEARAQAPDRHPPPESASTG